MSLRCGLVVIFIFYFIFTNVESAKNIDWWKHSVIYQIYPRSFKDSEPYDGTGDIKGITEKLDHLKDAGVTAAWLSPIYESPQVDHGYDISDFKKIDPLFGTFDDFKAMIKKANKLDIKIIMDFVPNHSSNKHEWFIKSEQGEEKYKDYYIWVKGTEDKPPNNWRSLFKGSAWEYSKIRKEWYLHQFALEQPDLNYRNPVVRKEMEDVLTFWLDEGVAGFRMDAVPYLVEDELLENEALSNDPNAGENDYEYLIHDKTSDQEETFNIIYDWRTFIDEYNTKTRGDERVMMTEAYTDIDNTMLYYGTDDRNGSHFTFNFLFITDLNKNSKAQDIVDTIQKWMQHMPEGCVANWVLGNHDQHRVATRFDPKMVDGLHMLVAFLPGVMITYNGEEIGQENGEVTWAQCEDPRACNGPEEDFEAQSRDFERTPFHWDGSPNAGFTGGSITPWLPVSKKYKETNLAAQIVSGVRSNYHVYQELLKLRQQDQFAEGEITYHVVSENVLAVIKAIPKGQTYIVIINVADKQETVTLSRLENVYQNIKVILASSASSKHDRYLSTNNLVLDPYESFVAKVLPQEGDINWWKHSVIYQIYPLSFKDSDNNGEGDINGIISKLDHLKDTGVTAAWLSPIYQSPQKDQGYDISNFREIDSRFGSMEDFNKLVRKAHELGIKIIMDFVPNHSSNEHDWFIKSEKGDAQYKDYYIWRTGKDNKTPPNNWLSIFKNSAWKYSTIRNEFYLHQFAEEQPDLNYRSPAVVQEMKDILKFWLDKGVDGFRMDAVPYLVEHDSFDDEPVKDSNIPSNEHSSLNHIYTSDQPETLDMIYHWREFVDNYTKDIGGDARVLMTEAYTDIKNTMKYYGDDQGRDGGHFTFNFQLITKVNGNSNARDIVLAIKEWLAYMPLGYTSNWVIGNHDNHRAATRFGQENADGFNMLIALLPGVMVTYNGEEIGQENGAVTWDQCKDISACNGKEEDFNRTTRDFERTPFHWDNTINAGFNEGFEPWLPVSRKYPRNNLAAQSKPEQQSHYQVYKKLVELRKDSTLINGVLKIEAVDDNVLACIRTLEGGDSYVLLFNVGNNPVSVNIKDILNTVTPYIDVVLASSKSLRSGQLIPSDVLLLDAHECIVGVTTADVKPDPTTTTEKPDDGGAAEITISFVVLATTLLSLLLLN